ncbi:hypothetical protein [Psychromonas aquatilis]|uniref:Uncharacterized protein n=1 Tax=Psychromonas aquatilis TaxID=2005072 RepID=A0ABU9GRN2_9GAMM
MNQEAESNTIFDTEIKRGVKKYHASNELIELMEKIRNDVNYSTKIRFNSHLFKSGEFDLINQEYSINNNNLKLFKPNKNQLTKIDTFFMSKLGDNDLEDLTHHFGKYTDLDYLINNFHILGSEKATLKELQVMEYTKNETIGISYNSPAFTEFYVKIIELTLMIVDFDIAAPTTVKIDDENPYIVKINNAIKNLPENNNLEKKLAQERGLEVDDLESFNKQCQDFKDTLTEEEKELQLKNKNIVSTLLKSIETLDEIDGDKRLINNCIFKIQEIIGSINNNVVKKKTNTDYIIHLLKNMSFNASYIGAEKLKSINEIKKNMEILNKSIANYNSCLKEGGLAVKKQYQYAHKVRLTLLKVAISNYRVIKRTIKKRN